LKGQYLGKGPWEDLVYKTKTSREKQQLTVIQQWREWLATVPDGNLPTNQKIEGYEEDEKQF
jgi:hypothetical protein